MKATQLDFEGNQHPVSSILEGDRVRVYDADAWEEFNGCEGEVKKVRSQGGGFLYEVLLDDEEEVELFYGREIKKVGAVG